MYVRVARGAFQPEAYEEMAERLRAAELELAPAISALPGLIDYYAGMDRDSSSMIRVSIWDSREHAEAMSELPEVLAVRDAFAAAGVAWEPSGTYDVSWWVQSP
jgi:quinol monooxygenase YgiN